MAETRVPVPEFGTREVTIEIPDALVRLFSSDRGRAASQSAAQVARDLSSRGAAAARSAGMMTAAARAAASPAAQAAGAAAAVAAVRATQRGAELAATARERGAQVAARTREEWLSAAQSRIQEARPLVAGRLQPGTRRARRAATVAGVSTQVGARAAVQRGRSAVGRAANAIVSFFNQFLSLLFWLGVVVWLVMRIFFPRREQRARLYARVRRLVGM